jgi:hypothetical protein
MTRVDYLLIEEAYSDILEERRRQPTTLMYHGTTSTFLRSILKHGLDPNPKQKSWDVEGTMPSLNGIYMAPTAGRSTRHAAKEAVKKYGGSPILITIQVVTSSGTPDEDNIFHLAGEVIYDAYREPDSPYTKDYVSNILTRLQDRIKPNQQTITTVKRFADTAMSIFKSNNYTKNEGSYFAASWLLKQPELRELMLSVLNTMKPSMAERPTDSPNVRITRVIGFRGKTRIVKINNMETQDIYYNAEEGSLASAHRGRTSSATE